MEAPPTTTAAELSCGEREELILQTMPLVYSIAKRLAGGLSAEVNFEDLVSAGTVGLIHAIDNFDRRYEAKLNTYAAHRIRGAMLDSVRSADWIPRRQRAHIKRLQAGMDNAQKKHQRANVSDQEVADELGVPLEEYRDTLASLPVTRVVSLEETDRTGQTAADQLSEPEQDLPLNILERAELHNLLEGAVRRLDGEEQTVLSLYYEEGLSPQEIAEAMGLPSKRVYQLKAQAILRLRVALNRRLLRKPTK